MIRPLPATARDAALLLARVLISIVMFAHGYQNLVNGIGRTAETFTSWGVPFAIVSAAFVTVVEFMGSILLVVGAFTSLVSVLMLVIMVGAAAFVHLPNGIFVSDGGWELVGVIAAGLIALAATGPGRFSVDALIRGSHERYRRAMAEARPSTGVVASAAVSPRAAVEIRSGRSTSGR